MITKQKNDRAKQDQIARQIGSLCHSLLVQPMAAPNPLLAIDHIHDLLVAISLTSDEYSLTDFRINNARRYVQSTEFGAARYEIRLFLDLMQQLLYTDSLDPFSPNTTTQHLYSNDTRNPERPLTSRTA